jgi:hypothetical protein
MRDSLTTARPRWQGGYLHLVQILLVLVGEVGWLTAWSQEVGAWFGPPENSPVLGWIAIVGLLVMSIVFARSSWVSLVWRFSEPDWRWQWGHAQRG